MLQTLPQRDLVVPNTTNPKSAVEYINSCMLDSHAESLNVDISFMNAVDACYVSTMCSSYQFILNPEKNINWYVSSKLTSVLSERLSLGNANYYLKD